MHFPIILELRRALFLDIANVVLHFAALAVVVLTPWPWIARLLAALACLVSFYFSWKSLKPPVSTLRLRADGTLEVRTAPEAEFEPAEVLPGARAHPLLTTLTIRTEAGRRYPLILTHGSCGGEEYRRMRVWVKCLAGKVT